MQTFQRNRFQALISNLKNQGILKSLKIYALKIRNRTKAFISDWIFETRFSTDTHSITPLDQLSIESKNKEYGLHYEPTRYFILEAIFDCLEMDFSNFGFVDFGSGKGRVLIFASSYGFGKITGVEFSRELCDKSRQNITAYEKKTGRKFNFEVLNIDAEEYPIHEKDNVFFFFNPFGEKVLLQVLDNIDRSVNQMEREFLLIYVNPVHKAVFSQRYTEIHTIENHEEQYNAIIYKKDSPVKSSIAPLS